MVYLFILRKPLFEGRKIHNFIAMNFDVDSKAKVKIDLKEEEIKEKYADSPFDQLSQLFNNLGINKIIVPSDDFKSSEGANAIICSVKAAVEVGYLYPLQSSLVFIFKPVMYIRLNNLRHVEFCRIGVGAKKTFDLTLTTIKGDQNVTFFSIEKCEQKALSEYFKRYDIKVRAAGPQPSNTQ